MAVTSDILRSHWRPRVVFGSILGRGVSERLGLVYLALAMVLGFVSQLPSVSRRANIPNPELEAAIAAEAGDVRPIEGVEVPQEMVDAKFQLFLASELMTWFIILPLAFYLIAMIGHLVARFLGSKAAPVTSRVAFFWAVLVATPLKLLHGLVYGIIGAGPAMTLVGAVWFAMLLWVWVSNLNQAGWGHA